MFVYTYMLLYTDNIPAHKKTVEGSGYAKDAEVYFVG